MIYHVVDKIQRLNKIREVEKAEGLNDKDFIITCEPVTTNPELICKITNYSYASVAFMLHSIH